MIYDFAFCHLKFTVFIFTFRLTFALTCDGAFLLRARRRQVQRVVRQRALSLGGPPWPCKTPAAQPVLHRQV
jgi:hypothetical protein